MSTDINTLKKDVSSLFEKLKLKEFKDAKKMKKVRARLEQIEEQMGKYIFITPFTS